MANFVVVGKRFIPCEHIALVEPYEASDNPRLRTSRDFHARVVLVNRDSILIEESAAAFTEANGFRMINIDRVATNPAIHFRVESFLPVEGFTPAKAYASRLLWRDLDGNEQSKLLLSDPETVLAVAVQGALDMAPENTDTAPRSKGRRQRGAPRTLAN